MLASGGAAVLANDGAATGCVEVTEAGTSDANTSKPLDEKSDNRGYGNVSIGVGDEGLPDLEVYEAAGVSVAKGPEIPVPCGAEPWGAPEYLTNGEALEILVGRDSGVRPELSRRGYRLAKRAFDVAASAAAVVVLLVPGLALCTAICAKSPGAGPIYSQWRMGRVSRDGSYRAFRMYKFRSMVPNADDMLAGLQESNEASGPMFKIRDDPRVIPGVGQFIRKHSIDELPQLVNVLKGDMSAVGPRPTADIHLPMLARHPYRCSSRLGVSERARLHSASIQPSGLSSSVSASWETGCGGDGSVSGRCAPLPIGAIRHLLD